MKPSRRRATYDDLLKVPEPLVAEILGGDLYATPRPALRHARATSAIGGDLWGPFDGPPGDPGGLGGWWLLFEPEIHLGADVVVPDYAAWRRERVALLPDVAYFDVPPDWACEVVSAATGAMDRTRKMPIYAREGVSHLWLVDPVVKTLEVYRLEAGRWVVLDTYAGNERVRAAPFDAIEVDLTRWWLQS